MTTPSTAPAGLHPVPPVAHLPPIPAQATCPDRPRERLWALGPSALSTAELIALLLGTGRVGEDAVTVARRLLALFESSLRRLAARPPGEILRLPGVGPAKGARLLAALELGQRLSSELRPPPDRITAPEDVVRRVAGRLRDLPVEEFHVLALDTQNQVLRDILVTRGLLDRSLVHPREVFRAAIAEAAAAIILVHNHPSGDPTPSAEDRAVTWELVAAGQLLDLPVYDHVIVAGDRWVSLAQAGLLASPGRASGAREAWARERERCAKTGVRAVRDARGRDQAAGGSAAHQIPPPASVTPRGTSCTSFRTRTGMARCGRRREPVRPLRPAGGTRRS